MDDTVLLDWLEAHPECIKHNGGWFYLNAKGYRFPCETLRDALVLGVECFGKDLPTTEVTHG